MLELLQKGGPLMWIILLCSVVALGVFLERLLYLHKASIRAVSYTHLTLPTKRIV